MRVDFGLTGDPPPKEVIAHDALNCRSQQVSVARRDTPDAPP